MNTAHYFSSQLASWLKQKQPKTVADLVAVFYEKSFAVCLLILMFFPALPLPTGGVTHVFEVVAMLLAFEMILGRRTIWLPRRWQKLDISSIGEGKVVGSLLKKLHWLESHSKPRLRQVIKNRLFLRMTGVFLAIFSAAAFLAPPFSGLDTLPSLGVVLIALSIIFEDMLLYILGLVVGVVGIGTVIVLGAALFKSFRFFFW